MENSWSSPAENEEFVANSKGTVGDDGGQLLGLNVVTDAVVETLEVVVNREVEEIDVATGVQLVDVSLDGRLDVVLRV